MMVGQRTSVWVGRRGVKGNATCVYNYVFTVCAAHTHMQHVLRDYVCVDANYNSNGSRSSRSSSSIELQAPPTLKLQLSALNLRSDLASHSHREREREPREKKSAQESVAEQRNE